jgi:hypothetical protein
MNRFGLTPDEEAKLGRIVAVVVGLVVVYFGFWLYYGLYLLVTGQS